MPTLELSAKDPASHPADVLVLGVSGPGDQTFTAADDAEHVALVDADRLPRACRATLQAQLAPLGLTGEPGVVHLVPAPTDLRAGLVALVGLGTAPVGGADWDPERLRRAAGAAVRVLAGRTSVALLLPADDAVSAGAVAEGAALGGYAFHRYRVASVAGSRAPVSAVVVLTRAARGRAVKQAVERAAVLAEAVHLVRDLVNTPPGDLFPAALAAAATEAVQGLGVEVSVLDERALAEEGYGGILGVGQGSVRPPRLVRLEYTPRVRKAPHLALVGKGITFDSGGLSIKPAASMETMKSDMAGAAAVLGTVVAVARLKLPVRLSAFLAIAENMPSGTAQRPSDVLTTFGGRTVEVLNTDAEGRLVLADALVAASRLQPDVLVDVATLTGAQVVALGNRTSAVMANDDALRTKVCEAAQRAGEQFWPMPLPEELRASLDSPVADLANVGDRYGGMLVAGLFLKEFVGSGADGQPLAWAHLDVAGPAFNDADPYGYTPRGGTGVAVRTLVTLTEDLLTR